MRQYERGKIYVGLKFTSLHFSSTAEIVAVRENLNQVDIKLISSEGHARIATDWNLQHVKERFDCGEYIPVDPEKDKVNISYI